MQDVAYRKLSRLDWARFKKSIMDLELEFFSNPKLYMDEKTYEEDFNNPKMIAFDAEINNNLVGYILGVPEELNQDSFYIISFAVTTTFQNKGIGTKLFSLLIEESRRQGYKSVCGHFRKDTSMHIMKKFNPQKEIQITNYLNTGETFIFLRYYFTREKFD